MLKKAIICTYLHTKTLVLYILVVELSIHNSVTFVQISCTMYDTTLCTCTIARHGLNSGYCSLVSSTITFNFARISL